MDDFLPITDAREVQAFLDRIPLRVDRERFARFVLGFPHRYLQLTPPPEMVAHFALVTTLGARAASTRLSREGDGWKLMVAAADRSFLFARIAGSLSFFGADIVSAEAFSNSEDVVLDSFSVSDRARRLESPEERRRFQAFLDRVLAGEVDIEKELAGVAGGAVRARLSLEWDDEDHPAATRLIVTGDDAFGLLHAVAQRLSESGCGIEIAHVETTAGRIRDTFYLSADGGKLDGGRRGAVERALGALA